MRTTAAYYHAQISLNNTKHNYATTVGEHEDVTQLHISVFAFYTSLKAYSEYATANMMSNVVTVKQLDTCGRASPVLPSHSL